MNKVQVGDIYPSKRDGNFAVIGSKGFGVFTVKFLNTGYIRDTYRAQVLNGHVKDKSVQVYGKPLPEKHRVTLHDGTVFNVAKLTHILRHITDDNYKRIANFRYGLCAHPEIASIEDL